MSEQELRKEAEVMAEKQEEPGKAAEGQREQADSLSPEKELSEEEKMEALMNEVLQRMQELEKQECRVDKDQLLAHLRAIDRASRPTLWDRITGAWKTKEYGRKLTDREKGIMYDLMLSRIYPVK